MDVPMPCVWGAVCGSARAISQLCKACQSYLLPSSGLLQTGTGEPQASRACLYAAPRKELGADTHLGLPWNKAEARYLLDAALHPGTSVHLTQLAIC